MLDRALGDLLLAVALFGHVELLTRLRAVDLRPSPPMWSGYARDGANMAVALGLWWGFALSGLGVPAAMLAATLTTLATYLLEWGVARGATPARRVRLLLAPALCAWLLVVALAPAALSSALSQLIAAVMPGRS